MRNDNQSYMIEFSYCNHFSKTFRGTTSGLIGLTRMRVHHTHIIMTHGLLLAGEIFTGDRHLAVRPGPEPSTLTYAIGGL